MAIKVVRKELRKLMQAATYWYNRQECVSVNVLVKFIILVINFINAIDV